MDLDVEHVAALLQQAQQNRTTIAPLRETYAGLTPAQAYAIQNAWFTLRMKEGTRLVGRKIGLTSKAMQEQLGVNEPDYGFLLDTMVVESGSTLARGAFIAPRVEPEIAFWLAEDVRGPGVTVERVLAATQSVCASLELVDSRVEGWRIKLVDTIADNASSARIVVSQKMVSPHTVDLAAIQVTLSCNGQSVGSGIGAAVLGHPAAAVAWLANKLAEYDVALLKGQVILPGAMCAAVAVEAGNTYQAMFTELGDVTVSFS